MLVADPRERWVWTKSFGSLSQRCAERVNSLFLGYSKNLILNVSISKACATMGQEGRIVLMLSFDMTKLEGDNAVDRANFCARRTMPLSSLHFKNRTGRWGRRPSMAGACRCVTLADNLRELSSALTIRPTGGQMRAARNRGKLGRRRRICAAAD